MPIELVPRPVWATSFYTSLWREHATIAPSIIAHLYELKAALTANIGSGVATSAKAKEGLYESSFELFASQHPGLSQLKAYLEETLKLAVAHVNGGKVDPSRILPEINESWFHITNDGGFHDAHFHNQCSWCGIYYLQAGDSTATDASGPGNGVNRFYCPLPSGGGWTDYGNQYLGSNRADFVPQDGLLVLFPSYLLHSALPYRGQRDRIAIAFNSRSRLANTPTSQ